MSEELRLVTDFAELRAGMLVVCKPCAWCGGRHRGMLTRLNHGGSRLRSGPFVYQPTWSTEPRFRCPEAPPGELRPGPDSVAGRRLFRVVDGLESTDAEEKPREKVRAR